MLCHRRERRLAPSGCLQIGDFLWVARRRAGAAGGGPPEVVLDFIIERKKAAAVPPPFLVRTMQLSEHGLAMVE